MAEGHGRSPGAHRHKHKFLPGLVGAS